MKTSKNGLDLIKKFEGCVLTAYKCPAGVWTIGYGHTAGVKEGQTITKAKALSLLKKDLEIYENHVKRIVKLELNQNQFDALVSFCYNCGAGCLTTLTKGRSIEQIADAIPLYNKAGGWVLAGLVKRRDAERELFLKPCTAAADRKVKITASALNIRAGAGVTYKIVGQLKKDAITGITEVYDGWGKLASGQGWICLKYTIFI